VLSTGGVDVLAALDPEQQEVATALDGPVCVLAGAGTGKTRAITHRIAHGVHTARYQPSEVLAVTFTTRAAAEMRVRLRALGAAGVQARTFHSAALRQARYFWPGVFGGELPQLVESKLPLLAEAVKRSRLPADSAALRDLAAEIEWAKVSNVRPGDYATLATAAGRSLGSYDLATAARIFSAYEEVKRERGRIDMEDVLLCAAALLAEDERVAAQVRRQYRWFVVDEFQDVSPIQQTLLDLWLGDRDDVCVVGDAAQTIYSFAGASADHLLGFARRYPGARVISLFRNYRSTPQVIRVANQLLASAGRKDALVLRAQRPPGPAVTFSEHPDEVAEAAAIAQQVQRLNGEGVALREIAVLFRINAASVLFEEALTERGIPYVVRGAERFFERSEVRQALTLVRGAARSAAGSSDGLVAELSGVLAGMGWSPQPPQGGGQARARWESLQALVGLAAELAAADPAVGLTGFAAEVEQRAAAQHAPAADGVTLATLHAAKGLEWDAVFLAGVQDGTIPIVYAEGNAAVEEERRLLYVGVTRARQRLAVSWAVARTPGGRAGRRPSRFLDGIRPADSAARGARSAATGARRRGGAGVARCRICQRPLLDAPERKLRRCHSCPSDYDEALFERLRAWRLEQAASEQLPAFCVFTDATLAAIAEIRPADASALVRIPGIGRVKLDKYGAEVLRLCAPPVQ
jgi:ATP-dependent DNA helicase UvrD/PcrA